MLYLLKATPARQADILPDFTGVLFAKILGCHKTLSYSEVLQPSCLTNLLSRKRVINKRKLIPCIV